MRVSAGAGTAVFIAIVVVVSLVIIVAAVLVSRSMMRNTGARAQTLAREWGWSYTSRAPWLEKRWRGASFPSLEFRIHHVLTGTFEGRPAAVCELYAYRTRLVVTALAAPAALPDVEFRPNDLSAKLARVIQGPIVATGHPEVDARWHTRTTSPALVRAVLTPGMVHLLQTGLPIPLRFVAGDVISWHEGTINPDLVHTHLARLAHAIDQVPDQVWQDYGYDPLAGAGGVQGHKE